MSEKLLTQEVGSLAKPNWRVAAIAGTEITDRQIEEAVKWSKKLGLDVEQTETTLASVRESFEENGHYSDVDKLLVKTLAAIQAIRLQENAGLDIIYDGEQDRSEMYQHSVQRTNGFAPRGQVRAFDNRWYKKFAVIDEVGIDQPWHKDEVDRLLGLTSRAVKVPVTGAYTLAAWSYDEHYHDRASLIRALATDVVRPNVQALLDQGVEWIQIDEPAATTVPDEVPLLIESFNRSVEGLLGKFSVHVCFSDYSLLFPHVADIENCSQFSLEFANRDSSGLGNDGASRPAYEILADLKRYVPDAGVGLGVVSIHEDQIEPVELVRDRILRAVDLMGDPTKVYPSPDCGLRTRTWDVAYEKLARTVEGTKQAKTAL